MTDDQARQLIALLDQYVADYSADDPSIADGSISLAEVRADLAATV